MSWTQQERLFLSLVLLVASLAGPPDRAYAQTPAMPHDVVRLKDGSIVRGVIFESMVDDHVTIQLIDGSIRKFEWGLLAYAGDAGSDTASKLPEPLPLPVAGDSSVPPSGQAAETTMSAGAVFVTSQVATLHLLPSNPKLTWHWKSGTSTVTSTSWVSPVVSGGSRGTVGGPRSVRRGGQVTNLSVKDDFQRICTAPCTAVLAAGTYRLGLQKEDDTILPTEPMELKGAQYLRGEIVSHQGSRVASGLVVAVGVILGGALILQTEEKDCITLDTDRFCSEDNPNLVSGAILMGVAALVGYLIYKSDTAIVEQRVTP